MAAMKLDIPDEDLPLFIRALEHYSAYLNATSRIDRCGQPF
jgi:hypothetical protein